MSQEVSTPVVQFGGVAVDMRLREVRRGADAVRLQEQPFQLLALMPIAPATSSPARTSANGCGPTAPRSTSSTASTRW